MPENEPPRPSLSIAEIAVLVEIGRNTKKKPDGREVPPTLGCWYVIVAALLVKSGLAEPIPGTQAVYRLTEAGWSEYNRGRGKYKPKEKATGESNP